MKALLSLSLLHVLLLPYSLHPHNQSGPFYCRRTGERDRQTDRQSVIIEQHVCTVTWAVHCCMHDGLYIWRADAPP